MRLFNVINAAEMAMYGFVGSRITARSGRRTSCACFMVRTALGVLGFAAVRCDVGNSTIAERREIGGGGRAAALRSWVGECAQHCRYS